MHIYIYIHMWNILYTHHTYHSGHISGIYSIFRHNQMIISLPLVAQEARDSDSEAVDLSDEAWDGGPSEISMGFSQDIVVC